MINIYSRENKIPQDKVVIKDVEAFFGTFVHSKCAELNDFEYVISNIDHAVYVDGVIKTPFGLTVVENLSTGCKAVLVYLWLKKMNCDGMLESVIKTPLHNLVLNLTECGANAILCLFRLIKFQENDLCFLLEHCSGVFVEDYERGNFVVNGEARQGGIVL